MFVQMIQGRTGDADGLLRQLDRWCDEVGAGATGYLGTTAGVADDGTVFVLARFEDEAAARANSDRPEQGAWWSETEKYFDGEVTFADTTDVDVVNGGGSDSAGFVQVMRGTVSDRKRAEELEATFMADMDTMRPDVLGMVRAWDGDAFTQVVYFTSEADARQGEQAEPGGDVPPAEFAEFMALVGEIDYLDLKDPFLRSA